MSPALKKSYIVSQPDPTRYETMMQRTSLEDVQNSPRIGRNRLCECGSGRKYKHCCGAVQPSGESVAVITASKADSRPARPAAARDLGEIRRLREAGRFADALDRLSPILRETPDDPAALTELGLVHLWAGRATAAVAPLRRVVAGNPRNAQSQYHLGMALEQLGDEPHAIAAFRQAVALQPGLLEASERLASLLRAHGEDAEALECNRRIAADAPETPLGLISSARLMTEAGNAAGAEDCLLRALTLEPSNVKVLGALAALVRDQGRFPEAIGFLERAIDAEPALATAYHDLVQCKKIAPEDRPLLEQMTDLLRLDALPEYYRIILHFALGKAFDDLGDYAKAIRHFDAGNRLARPRMSFDRGHFGASVNRVIAGFTPTFFAEHAGLGSTDETPVFVLGMPRSGTTLVEQILSSHPEVGAGGELVFWHQQAEAFGRRAEAPTQGYVAGVSQEYLEILRGIAPAARRVTDKMPANFLWIGLIHLVFPKARIIHCRRNALDTCLSNYFTHFQARLGFAYDRGDLAYYYRCYERLMAHWRTALPPGTMLDVDYERLIDDRAAATSELIDFCGLDWDPACLRPEDNQRTVRTASMWQVRQTPYRTSMERWRRYEPWLGELRQLLGPPGPPAKLNRSPETLRTLQKAAQLRTAGRLAEAIPVLLEAAKLSPNDPWVVNESGLLWLQKHALPQAIDSFEQAIALDPEYPIAHYNLACALERQRRPHAAIEAYQRAIALSPKLAEAHSRLGNLLHAQGRRDEALDCFRRASAAAPETTLGRLNRVKLLLEGDKPAEAEALLQHIVKDSPKSSEAWRLLGNLQREAGRFEQASGSLRTAIASDSAQVAAYHDLAQTKRFTEVERPLIRQMETRLQAADLNDYERALLHFALGKALDDLGGWAAAMRHFDAANKLEHAGLVFDRAAFAAGVDRLIALFTPERLAAAAAMGDPSELPVLIVGMPRSGTTLVEQIVSSHPSAAGAGEVRFWNEQAARLTERLEPSAFRQAAAEYLSGLRAIQGGAFRVTDKMPFNFLWAGLIHLALPNARIVHCRRDPVDTCLSIYFTRFATRQEFAYDRGDLVFYYRQYQRIMEHWRSVLPEDRFFDVDYAALVADPEATTRRLIAFTGLDWDDACLRPERNRRVVKTASMWQARQPVYQSSVARWRNYEPWLGELRALFAD